jgi:hypothetical protein
MSLPKILIFISVLIFAVIGVLAFFKKGSPPPQSMQVPIEVAFDQEIVVPALALAPEEKNPTPLAANLPDADRIEELFSKNGTQLPIVETLTYKSHVPWQKGRPAWLSDYAAHYETSRHFIARSLNGKPDYFKQDLAEGDRFNVLRKDKNFEFYLVVDTSRCRMWFYYIDLDAKQKVLLKTYAVGLGRLDSSRKSGLLTPLGIYTLGERIAIYKSKTMGVHQGKNIEMITVFGTRWIPFEQEIANCTAPAKGLGIHGTPWVASAGEFIDTASGIGKYESDGKLFDALLYMISILFIE